MIELTLLAFNIHGWRLLAGSLEPPQAVKVKMLVEPSAPIGIVGRCVGRLLGYDSRSVNEEIPHS